MAAKKKENLGKTLADNVRRLREKKGLSQHALADKIGVPQGTLSCIENGHRGASMGMVARIAKALGVPGIELFR